MRKCRRCNRYVEKCSCASFFAWEESYVAIFVTWGFQESAWSLSLDKATFVCLISSHHSPNSIQIFIARPKISCDILTFRFFVSSEALHRDGTPSLQRNSPPSSMESFYSKNDVFAKKRNFSRLLKKKENFISKENFPLLPETRVFSVVFSPSFHSNFPPLKHCEKRMFKKNFKNLNY